MYEIVALVANLLDMTANACYFLKLILMIHSTHKV